MFYNNLIKSQNMIEAKHLSSLKYSKRKNWLFVLLLQHSESQINKVCSKN